MQGFWFGCVLCHINLYGLFTTKFCLYINVYIYGEMVDFRESDKMIKISGKVDKSNTYNGSSRYSLFFILGRTSLNKE